MPITQWLATTKAVQTFMKATSLIIIQRFSRLASRIHSEVLQFQPEVQQKFLISCLIFKSPLAGLFAAMIFPNRYQRRGGGGLGTWLNDY